MNANKLLGKIRENNLTIAGAAENIGISLSALRNKITGKSQFNRDEIIALGKLLSLEDSEIMAIFFAD